jgi:nucleoside phosphorylase
LEEEMKKTYGTEIGSPIIIIKCISDAARRLATKIMVCKFLRKCHNEEVPVGVVTATG